MPLWALTFTIGDSPRKARRSSTSSTTSRRSSVSSSSHLLRTTTTGLPDGADPLGQALVLMGHPVGGVDHEEHDIGVVEGLQGPHHGVVLGALLGARPPPHPGGVDEADGPVGRVDLGVDGVARRPGQVVDDRALLAEQAVEQRRLAHVGPTDDGHPGSAPASAPRSVVGVAAAAVVGCLAPSTTGGAEARRAAARTTSSRRSPVPRPCSALTIHGSPEPEGDELPGVGLAPVVVDLVGHEQDRPARAREQPGHVVVLGR